MYLYSSLAGAALETLSAIHTGRTPFTLSGKTKAFCKLEPLVAGSPLSLHHWKACVRRHILLAGVLTEPGGASSIPAPQAQCTAPLEGVGSGRGCSTRGYLLEGKVSGPLDTGSGWHLGPHGEATG